MKVLILKDIPTKQVGDDLYEGYDRDEFFETNSFYDPTAMQTVCLNKFVRLGTVVVDSNAHKAIVDSIEHDLLRNSSRLKRIIEENEIMEKAIKEQKENQIKELKEIQSFFDEATSLKVGIIQTHGDTKQTQKQVKEKLKRLGKQLNELAKREIDVKARRQQVRIDEVKIQELETMQTKYTQLKEIFGDVKCDEDECD